jgi:hypothetical protein
MSLNPFFLQGSSGEQNLVQDLINEQIKMYGVEVYYLPRKYVTEKTVIKEVIESLFDDAYPIEAYLGSYEGYGDNPTILSKFGIQALNELVLVISKERFSTYITPLIQAKSYIKISNRPKEGDLIYFPLGKRVFEIKYVEHEKPFYQLLKNYTYELRCELFRYEDEVIDTGYPDVDDAIDGTNEDGTGSEIGSVGVTQTLTLIGAGVTATAVTGLINGGIRLITVTNRGGGYTSTPKVGISSAPIGGISGIGTATMIGGIVVCNDNVNPNARSVQSVSLINPGFGYTSPPGVRFIGGGGSGAAATASIGNGIIGIVTITNGGSGYSTSPNVIFTGVGIVSATGTAVISAAGSITAIRITNAGLGYTQTPTVRIVNPNLTGTGTYEFNEVVTGSISGTTARVKSWSAINNRLEVSTVSGEFLVGENIVGAASSAYYMLNSVNDDPIADGYADNSDIELEADKIVDFSEKNPFGMP